MREMILIAVSYSISTRTFKLLPARHCTVSRLIRGCRGNDLLFILKYPYRRTLHVGVMDASADGLYVGLKQIAAYTEQEAVGSRLIWHLWHLSSR